MIVLTRLDGQPVGINDEQVERIDEARTTVITLVGGNRYNVLESLDEIIEAIVDFRASVLRRADERPGRPAYPGGHLLALPDPDDRR